MDPAALKLVGAALRGLRTELDAAACSLAVLEGDTLVFAAADGAGAADVVGLRIPVSRGIAGWVVVSGEAVAVADVADDQRWDRQTAEQTGYLPRSILAVPVDDGEATLGVLEVLDRGRGDGGFEAAASTAREVAWLLRGGVRTEDLPAWSADYLPERLRDVSTLEPPLAWTRSAAFGDGRAAGVRVAVVDSGVDGSHPWVRGVAGAVAFEPDPEQLGAVRRHEGPHDDLYGHGTACAAIVRRLAPACEIYSVRVLNESLKGRGSVFLAGLAWAVENGMDVVNLSLSSRSAQLKESFYDAVDAAAYAGVVLVAAINNVPAPSYPSQLAGVLSVAAAPGLDPEHWYANPAPPTELGAAGLGLEVAWTGGSTIVASGNSFAAPHVAGMAARVRGAHPGASAAEVRSVLRALADNVAPRRTPQRPGDESRAVSPGRQTGPGRG